MAAKQNQKWLNCMLKASYRYPQLMTTANHFAHVIHYNILVLTIASVVMGIIGSLQQNRLIKSNQTLLMICIVIIEITTHQYGRYFGQR